METIRIGYIGLGGRGKWLLKDVVLAQGEQVVAVCDVYEDRAKEGAVLVTDAGQPTPAVYTDYKELLQNECVTTVIIATAWEFHAEIAIAAMMAGKAVAMEEGGAYTLEQCFDLIRAYEASKSPFMFLENCCFGRREMMALHMARQGFFGEIVHCSGGYHHDLRDEIADGRENRHYRLRNYLGHNCDNYPTHELGPIAKILNLNHGNRMMTLSSTASRAAGLQAYVQKEKPENAFFQNKTFAQGDIVTTVIRCAKGETIVLTLDTTLPRYYSRGFTVRGTRAMYEEVTDSVFVDSKEHKAHDYDWRKACINNAVEYEEEYDHPVWKQYLKEGVQGGHDGMDWLEFRKFFEALRKNEPMPVDVYDAASWMAVTALSEMSIAKGGAVVDVPDFTNGRWHMNLAD